MVRALRVYRVRRYLDDATGPRGEREGVSTYQVAVAFQEWLGELPIIGAGGKVAVLGVDQRALSNPGSGTSSLLSLAPKVPRLDSKSHERSCPT